MPILYSHKLLGTFITALAFVAHSQLFYFYLNINTHPLLYLSAFLLCFAGYYYLRFTKDNTFNNTSILALSIFLAAVFIKLHLQNFKITQYINIVLIASFVLYFYHSPKFTSLIRGNIILKPLVIAAIWLLLILWYTKQFLPIFYLHQFIFIAFLTIPFDIQTMHSDKFLTIPKYIGIHKTRILLILFTLLYIITSVFISPIFFFTSLIIGSLLVLLFFIPETYKGLLVYLCYDGIIILQTIVYFLIKNLLSDSIG